jgi:hypothetical protein
MRDRPAGRQVVERAEVEEQVERSTDRLGQLRCGQVDLEEAAAVGDPRVLRPLSALASATVEKSTPVASNPRRASSTTFAPVPHPRSIARGWVPA